MSNKTKTTSKTINNLAKQAGYLLMAGAATLGMLDAPSHLRSRIVVPSQPAFAFADNNLESEEQNNVRREREDIAPHYISYSEVQRTASRSGKA